MSQSEHIDLQDRFDEVRLRADDAIDAENWPLARRLYLRLEGIVAYWPNMTRGANGVTWRGEQMEFLRKAIQASGAGVFHETKIQHGNAGAPI